MVPQDEPLAAVEGVGVNRQLTRTDQATDLVDAHAEVFRGLLGSQELVILLHDGRHGDSIAIGTELPTLSAFDCGHRFRPLALSILSATIVHQAISKRKCTRMTAVV